MRSVTRKRVRRNTQRRGDPMTRREKGGVSKETFDDFLAGQGVLETCEDHAIMELLAESIA
ncbi:hypothetical protein Ms3S1_05760 [Methylosinus sp. 3S-1]